MTETELVMMSLTDEELHDAALFLGLMHDRWQASRRTAEAERRDALTEIGYRGTEGPLHALRALDLAIVRERAQRGGAPGWEAGDPLDGHPAAIKVRLYQERIPLNPDQGIKPRLAASGVLERVCPGCGVAKPLTVAFWEWQAGSLALGCRDCSAPDPVASRQAEIVAEEAAAPVPLPVAPFTPAELEPVPDLEAYL